MGALQIKSDLTDSNRASDFLSYSTHICLPGPGSSWVESVCSSRGAASLLFALWRAVKGACGRWRTNMLVWSWGGRERRRISHGLKEMIWLSRSWEVMGTVFISTKGERDLKATAVEIMYSALEVLHLSYEWILINYYSIIMILKYYDSAALVWTPIYECVMDNLHPAQTKMYKVIIWRWEVIKTRAREKTPGCAR